MENEYVIIGGGVVGLSVAWGLLRQGMRVTVLDGADVDYRASRGNFGLVWVQSKGIDFPQYAKWSQQAAQSWRAFALELKAQSGQAIELEQNGGWDFHFSEETLQEQIRSYEALREELGGNYPYEVYRASALKKEEPNIGPKVVAGILHAQDGHTNPLSLLRALVSGVLAAGGTIHHDKLVQKMSSEHGLYKLTCSDGSAYYAEKVVLAAGLGAIDLAPQFGFKDVIRPQRGQVLITEKMDKLIYRPSLIARQVNEGGIQIGASNEDVGFNEGVDIATLAQLARTAIDTYPALARAKLIRSWGALRILSPDGLPIYQESRTHRGVYWVTCHSGITLAPNHANVLPLWLEKNKHAPNLEVFSDDRF